MKSHRIWPIWKPILIRIFKSHRIFRPSYNTFDEKINLHHTSLFSSQAFYIWLFWGSFKVIFVKISQNFIKSSLRICLTSQISIHSLWHVWSAKSILTLRVHLQCYYLWLTFFFTCTDYWNCDVVLPISIIPAISWCHDQCLKNAFVFKEYMSHFMRKTCFCHMWTTKAQISLPSAQSDRHLFVRCLDSIIHVPILATSKVSRL